MTTPLDRLLEDATSFHDILVARAQHQPDTIVYRFHDSGDGVPIVLTYLDLLDRVSQLVAILHTQVNRGERVLISMPSCAEFVIAFFACQALGVIAVPVPEPKRNRLDERIENILDDAQPALLLTLSSISEQLDTANGERLVQIPRLAIDDLPESGTQNPPDVYSGDVNAIAFLQYTSGSTGDPKGVCVSNGNLLDNSRLMSNALLPKDNRVGVTWLPMFHDMGLIGGVLQPMYFDIDSTILQPSTFLMHPTLWLKILSDTKASIAVAPNFALDLCVDKCSDDLLAQLDLSSLRVLMCGAEPVQASTVARFIERFAPTGLSSAAVCPVYGLAEATLFVSGGASVEPFEAHHFPRDDIATPGARVMPASSTTTSIELVGCGPVVPGTVIAHPDTGELLKSGCVGEIWASGASVCQGYWQRPEQSAATFENVLLGNESDDAVRYMRTGDLGFIQSGELYVTGRIKDLIIIRGRNVYPQDVEHLASTVSDDLVTGASAAFMAQVNGIEEMVVLIEVSREGSRNLKDTSNQNSLLQSIREVVLSQTGVALGAVELLKPGRLLRTTSGKVRRSASRDAFERDELKSIAKWQRGVVSDHPLTVDSQDALPVLKTREEFEGWIVSRLAERCALPASEIALDQPFVHFGLDSLAAVELVQALERSSGTSAVLDATTLWDYPTIASLVEYLCSPQEEAVSKANSLIEEVAVDTLRSAGVVHLAVSGASSNEDVLDDADEIRRLQELLGS